MNLGAVSSLSGFMMSDVLYLRCLSVFGSLCGITYNATRQPAQWNGVAWGCVFISTNLYMIYNLLLERAEIKFSVDEGASWWLWRQVDPDAFGYSSLTVLASNDTHVTIGVVYEAQQGLAWATLTDFLPRSVSQSIRAS